MRNEPLEQKPDHQINLGGLQRPVWGVSLLPYLLSRIGLVISLSLLPVSDAVHCNRLCSALQPLLQCTASVLAVHCIFSRKRLHPGLQTLSSRVANVIILGCKRYPLCGPKNHSFADMGPRVKKYGIRASAFSGYQSDAGTVSRAEDIAQPHWSALLGRR